jgi:hypothetical protein
MQLLGTKRLRDGRQMLPAGGYSQPTENQGIMDMETGEIIALSKKDQRIADAKKNRKEVMAKLQAKVDKENAEKLALSEKEKKAKKKETLKLLEGRLTRVLDGLDVASKKVEEIKKQQTGKSTPKLERNAEAASGRKDGSLSKAEQFQKDIEDRMRGQTGSPQRKTKASGQQLVGSDAEKYAGINAPYIKTNKEMGGTHNLTISLDSPDTWKSGSINNSRLMSFSFDRGKIEVTTKSTDLPTFRKVKAATPEEAVQKINAYLKKNNLA